MFIANNQDWMTVWIERCQHFGHRLKWEFVSSLVIQAHCNGDPNVTPMVLDLTYDLRDRKICIRLLIMRHKFNINLRIDTNNLDIFE